MVEQSLQVSAPVEFHVAHHPSTSPSQHTQAGHAISNHLKGFETIALWLSSRSLTGHC